MAPLLRVIPIALLLAGCASTQPESGFAPAPTPLRAEFSRAESGESQYGPFVAATLAQQDDRFAASADYYLRALEADPDSRFVADRAFYQLLYAGRMGQAASVAVTLSEGSDAATNDDLVSIVYILEAFKREDWQLVRDRLNSTNFTGFAALVSPLLDAWSHVAEGDMTAAEQSLAPMLIDQRLRALADEHKAYMLDHLSRFEAAEDQYLLLADAAEPVSLQPFVAYAHMLARAGRIEDARVFLGEQAERFENNRFLLREGLLITSGRPPSQPTANPRGAVSGMFYRLASEFSRGNSPQAAIIYLRLASYLTPEVADIYVMLGTLLDQMGNPRAAAQAYDAVPQTSGLRRLADERRINALRVSGRNDLAEDALRDALRDNPDDAAYRIGLGDLLRERRDFDEAIMHYSRAIELNAQVGRPDWFAYFARGVCYEQTKDWPRAESDFLAALELSPDEPSVLNYLGYSWIDRGMFVDKAKGLIERAVEQRPNDGFIVDSLGWVNYLTGDYEEAVKLLEQAVRMEPDDATINHHLGDAYWRVGRHIEARFQWRHAIDSDPDEAELAELLDKLDRGLPEES